MILVPVILVGLLAVLPASATAGGAHLAARPSSVGVALTADPANGSAPLDVEFQASLLPANVSATFDWEFGDGGNYVQNGTGHDEIDHRYASGGTFTAMVTVTSTVGNGSAELTIDVASNPLGDTVVASPLSGPAPLTVHFTASPSGGTGTYLSLLWTFGDGTNGSGSDLEITYVRPGLFAANATVVDSAGDRNVSSLAIVVRSGAASPGPPPVPPDDELEVFAAAGILGLVAVGLVAYRRFQNRRPIPGPDPPSPAPESPAPSNHVPPALASPESLAAQPPASSRLEESRQLSERILVHLYWFGRPAGEGISRIDATQAGMARRLGATQTGVSKALQRLTDTGLVRVELAHVPGASRRVKTYSLTPTGESFAKSMRAVDPSRGLP